MSSFSRWMYRAQQRLAITRIEALTLLTICGLLALGGAVRHFQGSIPAFGDEDYATEDSLFQQAARGLLSGTAVDSLQMNEDLSQLDIPSEDTIKTSRSRASSANNGPVRMNINTASARLFERLPGIGPALAQRIVAWRTTNGPFRKIEDITKVSGIGPKKFEKFKAFLFLQTETPPADPQDPPSGSTSSDTTSSRRSGSDDR